MVKEDFPDPETPVTTISLLRGISTVIFFRLWTLAPLIKIPLLADLTLASALAGDFFLLVETGILIMRWGKCKSKTSGNPKRFEKGIRNLEPKLNIEC